MQARLGRPQCYQHAHHESHLKGGALLKTFYSALRKARPYLSIEVVLKRAARANTSGLESGISGDSCFNLL